jgi:very-short-patch-repair endonuclease
MNAKETKQKMRMTRLKRKETLGYINSEITKEKMSDAHKGKTSSSETKEKMRIAHLGLKTALGHYHTEETKRKMSEIGKKIMTKELIKCRLQKRPKSSLEIKFDDICKKHNLPYKFVGNGEFFIERKCPDFINCNGEKIAIEVFYRKHKEKFRNKSLEQWKQERQEIFNKYGWKLIFFNEIQVNEQNILERLGGD